MNNVFACVDGSAATTAVCDYASWAAQRLATPLTLLHILDEQRYPQQLDMMPNIGVDEQGPLLEELAELTIKRNELALKFGKSMLKAASRRALENGVAAVEQMQQHGQCGEILGAIEQHVRLFITQLPNHHRHLSPGSALETITRTITKPLLLVPNNFSYPRQVLLAFDGSDTARKCVKLLAESPIFQGLCIKLVAVGKQDSHTYAAVEAAANHLREYRHEVSFEVLDGDVQTTLLNDLRQHRYDLLIMGASKKSETATANLGSTSRFMLQHTDIPLLLLR